jgi:phenylacetate-CoA ligase
MAALPVLTKKDLRAFVPHGFIQKGYNCQEGFRSGEIEMVSTSGTAGERVSIVWNQAWWDSSEREAARLHPSLDRIFQSEHREAVLTTPVCAANMCHIGEAPMQERTVGNLLFLNQALDPTSWDDKNIRRIADELKLFQPKIIEADPAYLAILSRACLRTGYQIFQPECIVLTYEFPSLIHYRQIHKAFPGIPIISSYGSTETGSVFMQCEAGAFHQNTATCHVDIQPLRTECGDSHIGRILVTTFDNPWCVLLRFDVGDMARVRDSAKCSCGYSGELSLDSIDGRCRDITFDTKGRVVTLKQLDDALAAADGLVNYHLEQLDPQRYKIRYAAENGEEQHTATILPDILHTVYGKDAIIETSPDSALPPEQSGKFRLAYSTLPFNAEELFK